MHEGKWLKDVYVQLLIWTKINIYMKLNINKKACQKYGIQVKMFESSKLDYTSTSNGYK